MLLHHPRHVSGRFFRRGQSTLAFFLSLAVAAPTLAAAPAAPDAGQLLQNIRPTQPATPASPGAALPETAPAAPAAAAGGPTITIASFHIDGATAFSEQELQALLADAIGQSLTLSDIKARIERITVYYRQHGYLLARAWLPPQQIHEGSVEVRILEGQLGHLVIHNQSLLSDNAVRRQLTQLPEGKPVRSSALDRDLLLLNELPGAVVRSTLKPGEAVGSTDLDVSVLPGPRVSGSVGYDNDGNRYTGANRLTGVVRVNSPARQGDSLILQTQLARGIEYVKLGYQLPVGTCGTQIGGGASVLDYKLGGDFKALQAHGSADDYSLLVQQPLLRSRTQNLDAEATVDHKRLDDVTTIESLKSVNTLLLSLSGQRQDGFGGGGASSGSLSLTDGHLNLDASTADADLLGHHTAGHYDKLSLNLGRQQYLWDRLSLNGLLGGQWADKNLDSTEKMALGGASGVRAYAPGDSSADEALLLRCELRYAFTEQWQAGPFVDAARALLNKRPIASDPANGRNLAGEGVGIYWSRPAVSLQGFAAWRNGSAPQTPTHSRLRLGVQVTAYF